MDINEMKMRLEEELDTVNQELGDLGENDIDQTATEPDEIADRFESEEESAGETGVLKARKLEVAAALKRIEDGTYGMCEECGEKIEDDRLDANPAARTCKLHME